MDERDSGIILRTRPLTDTSLIVHWLTADHGRIATVAKGARRPKAPLFGKLDLFFEAQFSFQPGRRSDLHALREVRLVDQNPGVRSDYTRLSQLSYAVQLMESVTETDTPLAEVYALFHGFLKAVATVPPQPRLIYAFEIKFMATQGMEPDSSEHRMGEEARDLLRQLDMLDWLEISRLKAGPGAVRQLRQFLRGFLAFHLGRLPTSRSLAVGEA